MRVLYVVEGAAPYGANKSLIDLIDFARVRGVEPFVVCSRRGAFTEWLEKRHIQHWAIGHRFSIYPSRKNLLRKLLSGPTFVAFRILNALALFRILMICHTIRPHLVHTNIGPIAIGYLAARIMRIKHVWHLREYQDLDFGMQYFPSKRRFQSQLSKSARVICVANGVANHFGPPQNATVIPNGVAFAADAVLHLPKEDYFLFAGRLEATKGIEETLKAYVEYASGCSQPKKLLIAGAGDAAYMTHLRSLIPPSMLDNLVSFIGFREDVPALMRKATALIVASRNEGFGRITAEAMFNGCLVVGRDSGGTSEILADVQGATPLGMLFETEDSLVAQLHKVASLSSAQYRALAARAAEKASSAYSIEKYGTAVLDLYEELLNGGAST